MTNRTELLEMGESLEIGFLADMIVMALFREHLTDEDIHTLKRASEFIKRVKKGRQINGGRLGSQAIESIVAYNRAIHVMRIQSTDEKEFKEKFKENVERFETIIKKSIKQKRINKEESKELRNFFFRIGRRTLDDSSDFLERRPEVFKWRKMVVA